MFVEKGKRKLGCPMKKFVVMLMEFYMGFPGAKFLWRKYERSLCLFYMSPFYHFKLQIQTRQGRESVILRLSTSGFLRVKVGES